MTELQPGNRGQLVELLRREAAATDNMVRGVIGIAETVGVDVASVIGSPVSGRERSVASGAMREAADLIEALEARINEAIEALELALPSNVCLTNKHVWDNVDVPVTFTMRELRQIAAALTKLKSEI